MAMVIGGGGKYIDESRQKIELSPSLTIITGDDNSSTIKSS